jgi:hypothetical protein
MKTRYCPLVAIAITVLTSLSGFGQSDKISLRRIPLPNQTVRMKMVQETDIDMTMEGMPAAAGVGPMKMSMKNVTRMTQKNGAADSQGNIQAEITIDEASSDTKMSMNGVAMPAPSGPSNPMLGKKFTVVYDKLGNVVDSRTSSIEGVSEDSFKQLMKSFSGNLPGNAIAIGETVTAPLDVAIPLPLAGAGQMKMDGQVQYKLISVEKDGNDRIATIATTFNGKLVTDADVPGPNGSKIKMSIDIKLNGGGTSLSNLDKGFLKSSESKSTFGGPIRMNGGGNGFQLPNMNIQASMKVTLTAEN